MEARFRPVHISIRIPLSLHMRTAVYALWGTAAAFVPECAVYVQENCLNHFPYLPYLCDLILAKNKGPGNSLDPLKIFVHL